MEFCDKNLSSEMKVLNLLLNLKLCAQGRARGQVYVESNQNSKQGASSISNVIILLRFRMICTECRAQNVRTFPRAGLVHGMVGSAQ